MIPVVDILREVTTKTSNKLGSLLNGNQLNFLHGHPTEILNTLITMTQAYAVDSSQPLKYPLVAVFQDFPEKKDGLLTKATIPSMVIATLTDNAYTAPMRYDINFRPLLYPIYEEFLKQLTKHESIVPMESNLIVHTKVDRLYWGTQTAGKSLNDYVDAIEMMNTELRVQDLTNSCAKQITNY